MRETEFKKIAFDGAEVPPETVAASTAIKAKRERSLAQLPVYKEASKLLEISVRTVLDGPQKMRRYYDSLIVISTEILKSIALADRAKNKYRYSA